MDIANALPILHADMKIGLPSFVKVAHWPGDEQINQMPATAFADGSRRFPVFAKAAAFCSALVAAAEGCDEKTLNRITDACVGFGIAEDVLKYTGLFDTVKRASALSAASHALVIDGARDLGFDCETLHMLPIETQLDIEDSILELDKSAAEKKLPAEYIRVAAQNLMKAAETQDVAVPLGSLVHRLGHQRLPDYEKAAFLIENRVCVVPQESLAEYREVTGFLKTAGMEDTVVEGLRDLDAQYGVDYGFGQTSGQPSPWEIVFCGPNDNDVVKMASSHILIADSPVPSQALLAVADKDIDKLFRKEAAAAIKQARVSGASMATSLIAELTETQQLELLDLVLR